jgi:hypothetical protein
MVFNRYEVFNRHVIVNQELVSYAMDVHVDGKTTSLFYQKLQYK